MKIQKTKPNTAEESGAVQLRVPLDAIQLDGLSLVSKSQIQI